MAHILIQEIAVKKNMRLNKETLHRLELEISSGGGSQTDGCWNSRAFTNCTYCDGKTLFADCIEATKH